MLTNANRPPHGSHPILYRIMQGIVIVLVKVLYRYRVHGRENIPKTGTAMVVVNHLHLLDPAVVAAAISRQMVTLAAEKWRKNWFVRLFLQGAGVIFVNRGEVDRRALKIALEVLEGEGFLAVAPEGTRSLTGGLQRGKPGIAYLATRTNALIVPVAFWGVEKIRDWKRLKRPTCHVVIGEAFHLPETSGKITTARLQELTDYVMVRLGMLLPESYWGVYDQEIAQALSESEATMVPA